jgi:formylglycine-generating enzyme required for sulfatase activity
MRKTFPFLTLMFILGFMLSACNNQNPAPASTSEPTPTTILATATQPPPTSTNTPKPTATTAATSTPLPTETPAPTEQVSPTATSESALVTTGQPTPVATRVSDMDQMVQVYVPAGEFIMGSNDIEAQISYTNGRAYPEIPVFTMSLDGYWIDKFEVTNRQYALCVDAGACQPPYLSRSETRLSYYGDPEFDNYPVIYVSWYMATAYCKWAGRRLPTEAEWEKASRGTDGRKYPWGNDPVSGDKANFCDKNCPRSIANQNFDDGYADTAPVGSYPAGASPYGAMDMSGNVWEWTSSIIMPYPYNANDGREDPNKYAERVWRGGPWSNGYWWIRSSVRYRSIPTYWYVNLGFRCAASGQ